MKLRTILFLLLCCLHGSLCAQDLGTLIQRATTFDDRFSRETVYLHLDNASYLQGDTLWYKAYVVRASSLRPDSTLSRTLYVELLNDAGALLQRSVLRLDSIGQGHGNFALTPPLQCGYYEIRAYTRAMTNWFERPEAGHDATAGTAMPKAGYFSRVFPLFEVPHKALAGDFTELDISRPESELDFKMPHERPYDFGKTRERNIEFFPEGGHLVADAASHVAYRITDGRGAPASDTLTVFSAQGDVLATTVPEHLGMGSFLLPAGAGEDCYVKTAAGKKTYPLGLRRNGAVALHTYEALDPETGSPVLNVDLQPADSLIVVDEDGDTLPLRTAVVVFYRGRPHKVYPLDLYDGVTTLVIDRADFSPGVNRIEVVDAEGQPLASRLIFLRATDLPSVLPATQIVVRQNAMSYEAYDPIAIEVELKDDAGRPLPAAQLSVSVRDERGDLVYDSAPSLHTELLLGSEVRGYVHDPEAYFRADSPTHRRALDLLMQVQGWRPETMAQLMMTDTFLVRQPMEDGPIIRGRVIKDNDRLRPLPHAAVGMTMYNGQWQVFSAGATTDAAGAFAFEAKDDFVGDFTTQFNVRNEKGNPVWHRIMLDQWYGPTPRKYSPLEMSYQADLHLPPRDLGGPDLAGETNSSSNRTDWEGALFEWPDTIPHNRRVNLGEAVVKGKRKFVFELIGNEFDRYNYGGGEAHSIRHSDTYFNVDLEIQRLRDMGIDVGGINEFLCYLIGDRDQAFNPDPMIVGATSDGLVSSAPITESLTAPLSGAKDERGVITPDKVDGSYDLGRIDQQMENDKKLFSLDETLEFNGRHFYVIVNNHADLPENHYGMDLPEQIKSVIVSYNKDWATHVWEKYHDGNMPPDPLDGIVYVHTRPDWYKYKQLKGVQKRTLHGYTQPDEFKSPDYRRTDPENPDDYRRTLYWNPSLTTDADGRATAIFFANARWRQNLRITVRGITADGRIIEYDR